jgi:D-alanine-D-alanine ligase
MKIKMETNNKVFILYNEISNNSSEDEVDVLYQVDGVSKALTELGFEAIKYEFPKDIDKIVNCKEKPAFIFNLVESVSGKGKLSYVAPATLESLNIRYTGCSAESILLTTNKITTKKLLKECGISTPPWITQSEDTGFTPDDKYIIKAVYEDGSVGLYQKSVVTAKSLNEL